MAKQDNTEMFHWLMWDTLCAKREIVTMVQGTIPYRVTRARIQRNLSNLVGFASA